MKSIKIEDSTNELLQMIKQHERIKLNTPINQSDNDALIFKALCHFALLRGIKYESLKQMINKYNN